MADSRPETKVRESYDRASQRYFAHVRNELQHVLVDRASLRLFAELVGDGAETLDAGCGPGHIAAFLAGHGLKVSGLDISPAQIEIAEASFPDIAFRVGELADLPLGDASVDAVVARHSVIHIEPQRLGEVFAEFARVLRSGGRLFVSFFAAATPSDHGRGFDHAVCTAYQLDPNVISALLAEVGLEEEIRLVRQPGPDERRLPHATLFCRPTTVAR